MVWWILLSKGWHGVLTRKVCFLPVSLKDLQVSESKGPFSAMQTEIQSQEYLNFWSFCISGDRSDMDEVHLVDFTESYGPKRLPNISADSPTLCTTQILGVDAICRGIFPKCLPSMMYKKTSPNIIPSPRSVRTPLRQFWTIDRDSIATNKSSQQHLEKWIRCGDYSCLHYVKRITRSRDFVSFEDLTCF